MARRRPPAPLSSGVEPEHWPAWLLWFGRGRHNDPVIQAAIREERRMWKADCARWAREHRPDLSSARFLLLTAAERRQRTKQP